MTGRGVEEVSVTRREKQRVRRVITATFIFIFSSDQTRLTGQQR